MIRGAALASIAVTMAAVTFVLRIATFGGFSNDHYVHLSRGVQMLDGAWPVRDFVDPGLPLMYVVSALGQAVGGRTLLPELVIVAAAFAAAAGLTVWVVTRWTGMMLAGIWVALVQVVAFPRSYSYPKVLLYVIAVGAFAACAARPGSRHLVALATVVVLAFLFRHDHGLYIGIAALAVLAIAPVAGGRRETLRNLVFFGGCVALMVLPFLLYLEASGGVMPYFESALEFSRQEAAVSRLNAWPVLADPTDPDGSVVLFYAFWAIPIVTTATIVLRWHALHRSGLAVASGVTVLAACVAAGFLRDPLEARIADAVVPPTIAMAWLASLAFEPSAHVSLARRATQVGVVVIAVTLAVTSAGVGRFREQLDRADVMRGPGGVAERVGEVFHHVRNPYAEEQMPSDLSFALVPFYRYVQACTNPAARIFVPGFAPEVAYYARRGFAGGHVNLFGDFYSRETEQRQTIARLQQEDVPLVVIPPQAGAELERRFPLVNAFVRSAYRPAFDVTVDGQDTPAAILARRDLAPSRGYGAAAWPCFQ